MEIIYEILWKSQIKWHIGHLDPIAHVDPPELLGPQSMEGEVPLPEQVAGRHPLLAAIPLQGPVVFAFDLL